MSSCLIVCKAAENMWTATCTYFTVVLDIVPRLRFLSPNVTKNGFFLALRFKRGVYNLVDPLDIASLFLFLLLLKALQLHSLNVLAFSTCNFHFSRSWMQLVQFFIFSFFISFIISSSHLFFGLPSGRVHIGFHLYTLFYNSLFRHSL